MADRQNLLFFRGGGTVVRQIVQPLDLPQAWYLVLAPQVSVSTASVFSDNSLTRNTKPLKIPPFFAGQGANDLEAIVARRYPAVAAQLAWLKADLQGKSSSTPIVVFAHIPLWALYPQWGWGTDDSAQALALLKRFGSVTVLNGHVHQVAQKVEGEMRFYSAMSTAFPQPAPGAPSGPGPMKVPAEQLRTMLGLREVTHIAGRSQLAITDTALAAAQS